MSSIEIISLIVTIICLAAFCLAFTFLFRFYFTSNIKSINKGDEDIEIIDYAIESDLIKKSKAKRIRSLILKILSYVVLGITIVVFGCSLYGRFTDNIMAFGDSTLLVIASGSMSYKNEGNEYVQNNDKADNQFNTYDIIGISKYEKAEDVSLYDVVAYKSLQGEIIVHRIIHIVESDGTFKYETQGDANAVNDTGSYYSGYLSYDSVIGYYNNTRIEGVGAFVIFLQSNAGIITIFSIVYCYAMYDFFSSKYRKALDDRIELLSKTLNMEFSDGVFKKAGYYEELIYKDKVYVFDNGAFVSSKEIEKKKEGGIDENEVVFKKKEDGKEVYEVKNISTNEERKYTEEEAPSQYKIDGKGDNNDGKN